MKALIRRSAVRVATTLRDAWLIIGITGLLVLSLEAAYRLQRAARRAVFDRPNADSASVPLNPFDTTAWAAEYLRDHLKEEEVRWAPYVYVRNPSFRGRHITVDSLGHRVTPQAKANGAPTVRIFFLGGSTTFGWFQREAYTIPAEAARRLQSHVGTGAHIEVTNFGVPGHTFTQEIIELMLQLRAGSRPDVVVFYDGINDAMATIQNGKAGFPQNEWNRESDFARGRALTDQSRPGIANDLRAVKRAATTMGGRLEFVRRIIAAKPGAPSPGSPADSLARDIVRVFAENARIVEALAATYRFEPLYLWQPALMSSAKRLTAREKWLDNSPIHKEVHLGVPRMIDSAMKPIAGARFIDGTDLFRGDTLEIFADTWGHTYERANPVVVDTMMPALSAAVTRAISRRRSGGSPVR